MNNITFKFCDYKNPEHLIALASLINHYMEDPMGDCPKHDKFEQLRLIDGLANHPTALVLFVLYNGEYAGLATCFVNFSTFSIKPYLYIHDIIIQRNFRGQNLGRSLMEELISFSLERGYCKITLEVREDNTIAKKLYSSLDFSECEPRMLFWSKTL